MRVRNINAKTQAVCTCGNWLQHWLNCSRQPLPRFCAELRCLRRPTMGAHVQKAWALDDKWYIVPLCAGHNAQIGRSIELAFSAILVSTDISETCGRKPPAVSR